MYSKEILNKIKQLQKEYKTLNIFVDVTLSIKESIQLHAVYNNENKYEAMYLEQGSIDLDYSYDINQQDIIIEQIENQIKNHKKELQKRINEFNEKCITLAKELEMDLTYFIEECIFD